MKKYSIILNILGLFFVLVAGIWAGMLWQNSHIIKEDAYEESHGTDIAVVNQDLGVPIDDQTINYANAVIETLGSDYTVVSLAAAETGLGNGTYGAVVTFPADFSENIISINQNNPRQAVLDLAVSKRLPEDSYISLYTKLISMEQQVNNNMAYAYVESVFGELHSAQDDVKKLLANDETDMSAVEKVRLAKYIEMLDLGDIPKVEFNPVSPDFEALLAKVQTIADDMNQVYVDSYAVAQAEYSKIQKQISDYEKTITEQSDAWIVAINAWSGDVSGDKTDLEKWREEAEKYHDDEGKYRKRVDAYKKALDVWGSNANTKISEIGTGAEEATNDMNSKIESCENVLSYYYAEVEKIIAWADYIEKYDAYILDSTTNPYLGPKPEMPQKREAENALRELTTFSTYIKGLFDGFKAKVIDIPETPSIHNVGTNDGTELAIPPTFIRPVPEISSSSSGKAPEQPEELTDALKGIVSVSAGYNPDEYFDDKTKEKAQQYVTTYSTHLDTEKSEMESKNASNLQQLTSAYQAYNKHVGDLRMKITEVHTKEQENLQKSITGLSDTLKKTSKDNHELMDSFVDRMPNSRNESTVNQEVVEATVTPIGYSYDYIRVGEKPKQSYAVTWLLPILIVLLLSIVLVALIIWIKNRKQWKELE